MFATVESLNVVPARARIGGTVAVLSVRNGDPVTQGQVLAVVGDPKLALEMSALEAQIAGAQSQLLQAQSDLARAETLLRQGSGPRVTYDQARTAVDVATSTLRARTAGRDVIRQQMVEGEVLAPVVGPRAGRAGHARHRDAGGRHHRHGRRALLCAEAARAGAPRRLPQGR